MMVAMSGLSSGAGMVATKAVLMVALTAALWAIGTAVQTAAGLESSMAVESGLLQVYKRAARTVCIWAAQLVAVRAVSWAVSMAVDWAVYSGCS